MSPSERKKGERRTVKGSHAYERLDRVLHEKARLGILTALAARRDGALFTDLKELCSLTDGNLSRHVQVLAEAGLVEVWKGQDGGRTQTLIRLSAVGREQFLEYLEELEQVIRDARRGVTGDGAEGDAPPGWVAAQ